ncbi:hypothetical protein GGF46_003120 [Coemansia sp. RSA 552]|nr:hypothetical protein GGF46_003120 [Coemansia sp. RSA 552]
MQLTKKQRKALQFRGKLDKPTKEDRPERPQKTEKPAKEDQASSEPPAQPTKNAKFEKKMSGTGKAVRFIAFVGNLPFSATADDLREMMASANPTSVRLSTDKVTGKSRGFAFVEFETSADLRRAIRFHHLPLGNRQINVELTVGGGGNSGDRRKKIQDRREDLEKERSAEGTAKRQKLESKDDSGDSGDKEAAEPAVHDEEQPKAKKPNRRKRGRGSHK